MTNRLKALAIVLAMLPVCLPPTPAAAYPSVLEDLTGSVPSNPEAGIQTVSDDERAGGAARRCASQFEVFFGGWDRLDGWLSHRSTVLARSPSSGSGCGGRSRPYWPILPDPANRSSAAPPYPRPSKKR